MVGIGRGVHAVGFSFIFVARDYTKRNEQQRRKEKAEYGYPECRESEVLSPGDVGEGRLKMSGGTRVSLCLCVCVGRYVQVSEMCVVTFAVVKGRVEGGEDVKKRVAGRWLREEKKKKEK